MDSGSILCKGKDFGRFHHIFPRAQRALDPKVGNKADGSLDYVKVGNKPETAADSKAELSWRKI